MTSARLDRVRASFAELLEVPRSERQRWLEDLARTAPEIAGVLQRLIAHDAAPFGPLRDRDEGGGIRYLGNADEP